MMKQWDKNGDGELNEEERTAMRVAMRERLGAPGGESRRREGGREPAARSSGSGPARPADAPPAAK